MSPCACFRAGRTGACAQGARPRPHRQHRCEAATTGGAPGHRAVPGGRDIQQLPPDPGSTGPAAPPGDPPRGAAGWASRGPAQATSVPLPAGKARATSSRNAQDTKTPHRPTAPTHKRRGAPEEDVQRSQAALSAASIRGGRQECGDRSTGGPADRPTPAIAAPGYRFFPNQDNSSKTASTGDPCRYRCTTTTCDSCTGEPAPARPGPGSKPSPPHPGLVLRADSVAGRPKAAGIAPPAADAAAAHAAAAAAAPLAATTTPTLLGHGAGPTEFLLRVFRRKISPKWSFL